MKKQIIFPAAVILVLLVVLGAAGLIRRQTERPGEASGEAAALEETVGMAEAAIAQAEMELDALREQQEAEVAALEQRLSEAEARAEAAEARAATLETELYAPRLAESVREHHRIVEGAHSTAGLRDFQYLLYIPEGLDAGEPHPLLVFLHGSGGCGKDLEKVYCDDTLPTMLARGWLSPNALVLIPQCPGDSWSAIADDLLELIEYVAQTENADRDRISLTGFSLGALGCFTMLIRYPEFFAAAAPVSGECSPGQCAVITSTPVRILRGEKDTVLDRSVLYVPDVIREAGGDCELILYPGEGHFIQQHYMDDGGALVEWLISQRRTEAVP